MKCQTHQQSSPTGFGLCFCKKCSTTVPFAGYFYCDKCSQQLQQCEVCGIGVGSSNSGSAPKSGPTVYSTKVTAKQNGQTIKGVRVGENIEITLDEDQYSGKEWGVKSKDWQFSTVSSGQFTQNPQNPQYGVRTFVFSCSSPGPGDIELHEVQRSYSWGFGGGGGYSAVPGGKTFKVSIDVS